MNKGQRIYKSPQNISVYQNWRYRWVLFDKRFIQTMIHRRNPAKPILPYIRTFLAFTDITPGEICLLGLGGGSSLHYLLKQKIHSYITVIEKYSEMIHIAKHYFYLPKTSNYQILCLAAEDFVQETEQKFNHLLVDLGDINGYPSECQSTQFFENCYRILKSKGIMALNITHHNQIHSFKKLIEETFNQSPISFSAKGNWILFVGKDCHKNELIQKLLDEHILKTIIWDEKYGELALMNHPLEKWFKKVKSTFFIK